MRWIGSPASRTPVPSRTAYAHGKTSDRLSNAASGLDSGQSAEPMGSEHFPTCRHSVLTPWVWVRDRSSFRVAMKRPRTFESSGSRWMMMPWHSGSATDHRESDAVGHGCNGVASPRSCVGFGQRGKDVAIEHFGAEGAVEALDVRVLGGFTRLVMQQFDAMALRPLFERRADELWAVLPSEA